MEQQVIDLLSNIVKLALLVVGLFAAAKQNRKRKRSRQLPKQNSAV